MVKEADREAVGEALSLVGYLPDAQVLAEAVGAGGDYFVSLDRKHIVGNPKMEGLAFRIGTPGEFLAWYRASIEL